MDIYPSANNISNYFITDFWINSKETVNSPYSSFAPFCESATTCSHNIQHFLWQIRFFYLYTFLPILFSYPLSFSHLFLGSRKQAESFLIIRIHYICHFVSNFRVFYSSSI